MLGVEVGVISITGESALIGLAQLIPTLLSLLVETSVSLYEFNKFLPLALSFSSWWGTGLILERSGTEKILVSPCQSLRTFLSRRVRM